MTMYTDQDARVAAIVDRLSLDHLTICTGDSEPDLYLHCGRDLTLGEWREIERLAMELQAEDLCARVVL